MMEHSIGELLGNLEVLFPGICNGFKRILFIVEVNQKVVT